MLPKTSDEQASNRVKAIGAALAVLAGCTPAAAAAGPGTGVVATSGALLAAVDKYPFGDDYLEPIKGSFDVDSFYGSTVGQPGQPETFQGTEQFAVYDSKGNSLGTIDALVSHSLSAANPNLEVLVLNAHQADPADASALPDFGSVFNWAWTSSDPSSFYNIYVDLVRLGSAVGSAIENTVSDTGIGNIVHLNAFAHIDVHNALVKSTDFVLPNGDHVIADPGVAETYTAVTNTSPWAVAVQGMDTFEIVNPKGDEVGTFRGQTISTADGFGGHSYEILVTGGQDNILDPTAGLGSGADQLPTDGSLFNMLYLFSPNAYNIYTDYAGTGAGGADQISELWNLFGLRFTTTPTFDAAKGLTNGAALFSAIPFDTSGATITPADKTVDINAITGINGMPNGGFSGLSSDVQSNQEFTLTEDGKTYTFQANVMSYADGTGKTSEDLYLNPDFADKDSLPPDLPVGSVIEYTHDGWWSTLEIDPGAYGMNSTTDAVTQELFTSFGDFTIKPSLDGLLGLVGIAF